MDYQLIRAYCAKDLNDILKPRDKWYSTPESRFEELECQILRKHRTGARCLEPRQYAAAVCLRALELLKIPFEADDDCPEFTQTDSVETGRQILADSLAAYVLHLSESESRPLMLGTELAAFTASIAEPQQTAPAPDTTTPAPAPVRTESSTKTHSNKSEKTLIFEAKVLELLGKFWNDRKPDTKPTKAELCGLVYAEILRTDVRGERKTTQSMVTDAAKSWRFPLVLPGFVADSKFNDKRHPFKGDK